MKNIIIIVLLALLVIGGGYFLINNRASLTTVDVDVTNSTATSTDPNATTTTEVADKTKTVIGQSVDGRDIAAYHYGEGEKEIMFVGGIHGGYEWNTVLVARELMDYLASSSTTVPNGVKVTVVPLLNPDGLSRVVPNIDNFTGADVSSSQSVVVSGRFNSNNVDLNRNFDCDWQATAKWQNKDVSGGTAVFSEPESRAIKSYIEVANPQAVVVWYSASGGVFASNCHNGVSTETDTLTSLYAKASGYPAHQNFDFYETTGDMTNWLAKNNIPAISVLLTDHKNTEWSKNKAGIEALLEYYSENE